MVRLKQALVLLAGLILAGAMVGAGLWQLDVYHQQGADVAARRAAEPPLPLSEVAPAGGRVIEAYGRSVTFTGEYDASRQLLVADPDGGGYRVLTAVRQADGSVLPVVRGRVSEPVAPPPPAGLITEVGILLPSEDTVPGVSPPGQLTSVRLPLLAQQWPGPFVDGFVTLRADDAVAQQLAPASVALPEVNGRLRNAAYALQWWIFAAFALAMAGRMARDLGRTLDAPPPVSTTT